MVIRGLLLRTEVNGLGLLKRITKNRTDSAGHLIQVIINELIGVSYSVIITIL